MDRIARVERLTRWRAHVSTVLGIVFVAQGFRAADWRVIQPTDYTQLVGWAVWLTVLLGFLLFGSGLLHGAAFGALVNDETTAANRRTALLAGFWAMLATAAGCYAVSFHYALGVRPAIHVIVAMGVGVALMRFGGLERKALKA
ncbi:MAG: hypothetical protein BGP16_07695 [Sphingobium sp. 66-54]|nr:MAG: hypothetical protein BGP16_07695 [Sphingobium sp. 66-54]